MLFDAVQFNYTHEVCKKIILNELASPEKLRSYILWSLLQNTTTTNSTDAHYSTKICHLRASFKNEYAIENNLNLWNICIFLLILAVKHKNVRIQL